MPTVPVTVMEAATASGSTSRQLLWKVQLPMSRRALLVAANQGIVMVLAMVVVGALVGAGALGYDVIAGFAQGEDFGKGLAAGTAIVLLGIMLDRITTAASQHSEKLARGQNKDMAQRRGSILVGGAILAAVIVYASRHYTWAAAPWNTKAGSHLASGVQSGADWISSHISSVTAGIADGFSNGVLNPLQALLAGSPWWVTGLAIVLLALIVGTWRGAVAAVIWIVGLWMVLQLRRPLTQGRVYAFRMVGIMALSGAIVLAMSAYAMLAWSVAP